MAKKSKRSASAPIIVLSEKHAVKVRKKAADAGQVSKTAEPTPAMNASSPQGCNAVVGANELGLLNLEPLAEGSVRSIVHEQISCALETGLEIIDQAERADKPSRLLGWLVAPLSAAQFETDVREKRPLHIERSASRSENSGYYSGWFGSKELRALLAEGVLRYTDDLDVTSYMEGKRKTLNGQGVASADEVWAAFERGCSLRLSWPQRYHERVWALLNGIEEHFCCGAGCNMYFTPKGMQGFAPHFDDVDVFILQVEGEKLWTLHAPLSEAEALPRFSSADFTQSDLGEPLAEINLRPGDLLYLPRGIIHQARGSEHSDSLHLTVSICRQHSWRDFLEVALLGAIDVASAQVEDTFQRTNHRNRTHSAALPSPSTQPHSKSMQCL